MASSFGAIRAGGSRRDLTGLFVVLALFVMASVVIFHSDQTGSQTVARETSRDPSVENTRASGSRGLYDWVNRLGYRHRIWRRDFTTLPADAKVLVCVAPVAPAYTDVGSDGDDSSDQSNNLTAAEGAALKRWVAKGHAFILFASQIDTSASSGDSSSGSDGSTFENKLGLRVQTALQPSQQRDFAPVQPSVWTQGVDTISLALNDSTGHEIAPISAAPSQILFGDAVGVPNQHKLPASASYLPHAIGVVYPIGRGHVIALADDEFGSNANLARSGNAQFIADVLSQTARRGDTVLFDEYHRDYGGMPSPSVWAALGAPLQYGLLQLALAGLVALLVLAPRLGRTEPLNRSTGHTTAEYVASLAGLYQSARATNTALETIYRQFLREICSRYSVPTDTTLDRLADVAARRGGVNAADLRKLLIACEQALDTGAYNRKSGGVSTQELITMVRAIERYRKELGIG